VQFSIRLKADRGTAAEQQVDLSKLADDRTAQGNVPNSGDEPTVIEDFSGAGPDAQTADIYHRLCANLEALIIEKIDLTVGVDFAVDTSRAFAADQNLQ
jgi:hypothetical protein